MHKLCRKWDLLGNNEVSKWRVRVHLLIIKRMALVSPRSCWRVPLFFTVEILRERRVFSQERSNRPQGRRRKKEEKELQNGLYIRLREKEIEGKVLLSLVVKHSFGFWNLKLLDCCFSWMITFHTMNCVSLLVDYMWDDYLLLNDVLGCE